MLSVKVVIKYVIETTLVLSGVVLQRCESDTACSRSVFSSKLQRSGLIALSLQDFSCSVFTQLILSVLDSSVMSVAPKHSKRGIRIDTRGSNAT